MAPPTRTIAQAIAWLALLPAAGAAAAHEPPRPGGHTTAPPDRHARTMAGHRPAGMPQPTRTQVARPALVAARTQPRHGPNPAVTRASPAVAAYGVAPAATHRGSGTVSRDRVASERGWSTGWRSDRRYDWAGWRALHRDLFRPGYYRPPDGGYAYARLDVGALLAAEFLREQYWINDPWYYHLPPATDPYRWVRYYNDCLLIDIDTGEVVDVVENVFW